MDERSRAAPAQSGIAQDVELNEPGRPVDAGDEVICAGCGATLQSRVRVCPDCGLARESSTKALDRPLLAAIQSKSAAQSEITATTASPLVYLSPEDDRRRFPLLTRAQITLIGAGLFLLILMLLIGFLLWRQQKRESVVTGTSAAARVVPSPTPTPSAGATVSPTPVDDAAILASARAAVTNYNPTGYPHYTVEVKDGIVTVTGEAETQPEKDGVENVIRPIAGVRAIVNNLVVRLAPVIMPYRLNEAEARRLDDALRKGLESDKQAKEDSDRQRAQVDGEHEGERKRREAAAAKIREEEERLRREAEEKLQREAAEYERRLEEQRRLEAERRTRAEQARLEASVLRSGTIAWSAIVDGAAEILISGGSASVRNLGGEPPREVRSSFSAPVPRAPIAVKLLSTVGRGSITIAQEPSAANGYTTIVRVDDSARGGQQRYEFTLRWSVR